MTVTEPLRLSFRVACSSEHAFAIWTTRVSTWWPADHTVSGRADAEVVIEGRVGGRIFERTPSGDVHEWGEVTDWVPPTRRQLPVAPAPGPGRRHGGADPVRRRGDLHQESRSSTGAGKGWAVRAPTPGTATAVGWSGLLPHYLAACAGPGDEPFERPQPAGRGRGTEVQQGRPS